MRTRLEGFRLRAATPMVMPRKSWRFGTTRQCPLVSTLLLASLQPTGSDLYIQSMQLPTPFSGKPGWDTRYSLLLSVVPTIVLANLLTSSSRISLSLITTGLKMVKWVLVQIIIKVARTLWQSSVSLRTRAQPKPRAKSRIIWTSISQVRLPRVNCLIGWRMASLSIQYLPPNSKSKEKARTKMMYFGVWVRFTVSRIWRTLLMSKFSLQVVIHLSYRLFAIR